MIRLWRVFPLDATATHGAPGGALFCPRSSQGAGRHDHPDEFGVIYVSETASSAIAEHLAPFRGSGTLTDGMLHRAGRRLALAALTVESPAPLVDLDEPLTLHGHELRPSQVATRQRAVTQEIAARLYHAEPKAIGLRWWSTLESSWINTTLFAERALARITVAGVEPLTPDHGEVHAAAVRLGLR